MFQYELSEIEIKRTFPFKITSKTIKHLGINLIKEGKNLHIENYKTFMQERKDTNKWKDTMFMDWKV